MAEAPQWHVKGDWFDVCRCDVPCPCEFAQPPTDGYCEGVLVWHVNQGNYGQVLLDGLSVLALGTFEGNIWSGKATNIRFGLFFDETADEAQREALQMVFGGQAGGFMAELFAMVGDAEIVGAEFAPIHFELADDLSSWRAEVPGKVEASAEALTGPTTPPGERVQTLNPPGSETGGRVATWAIATRDRAEGFGLKWEWDGKSSKHIPFEWSGP